MVIARKLAPVVMKEIRETDVTQQMEQFVLTTSKIFLWSLEYKLTTLFTEGLLLHLQTLERLCFSPAVTVK